MAKNAAYRVCARCVMDTSDPEIVFDETGLCSHCRYFEREIRPLWTPGEADADALAALLAAVKAAGKGRKYDCIAGLSGGVDSSFLVAKLVEWGLRPLIVHVDVGWNSELVVLNIERLIGALGLDLETVVVDWDEMRDLQRAFLRAQVANQDIPQDHAIAAALLKAAIERDIAYVVNGTNFATESILPRSWGYDAMDSTHIRDIHRRFGEGRLKTFPLLSFRDYYVTMQQRLKFVSPLNLIRYDRADAAAWLEERFGWRDYGAKHHESVWNRWYQAHYLPAKFGYDKRRAHFSSRIVAGAMTRDEAMRELEKPLYSDNELAVDTAFVAKKLGFEDREFAALIAEPPRDYRDFATNARELARFHKMRALKAYLRGDIPVSESSVLRFVRRKLAGR